MNQFRRLLPYIRPRWRAIAAGMVFIVLANISGVVLPALLGQAIDALGRAGVTEVVILRYAAAIVSVALLAGAARFGMRQILNSVSRRIECDLRDDFFRHLMHLDAGFFGRNRTGDLMSRATNDTMAVRMAVGPGIMYLVNTVVTTALALVFMVGYSLRLTIISLVPLAALPPVMLHFGRIIHRRFERIQNHFGVLSTMVQENLSGVRIVRSYVQEDAQEAEFDELNRGYLERNMDLARTSALFNPLLTILTGLGMLVVLWFGGQDVMARRITAGDFVAFGFYLAMLTWPMIALGWVINLFQRGAASMERINHIMDAHPAVASPHQPAQPDHLDGDIEFRHVSFRYPGSERDVLVDVSFHIPAGTTAALVGPTGAGKSTIIALMTRRYDPAAGQVLLDGVLLSQLSLERLRSAMGVVPQDAFVFSESIGANIAVGLLPDVSPDGRVEEAAETARLSDTIALFPHGFETLLGERGVNLSGGQRQRTTLARALARDPRVLILDDALSAVDTHTETEILENLRQVLRGRTAVIVSHRVSAVMNADQILVLDEGRIVERGTHAELVARDGLYVSLLHRQLLAEGLEGQALAAGAADL